MKKTIKVAITLALVLVLTFTFASCTVYIVKGCVENTWTNGVRCRYEYLQGERKYFVTVKSGEIVDLTVKVTTESGKLGLRVELPDRQADYQGSDVGNNEFVVYLLNPGVYTITVNGQKHKGSYEFSWKTVSK